MTHQWKIFSRNCGLFPIAVVVQRRSRLVVDRCEAAIDEQAHRIWRPLPIDSDHAPVLIG